MTTSPYTDEEIMARIQSSIDIGSFDLRTRGHLSKTTLYYLSFVDGKWLGVSLVSGDSVEEAMFVSHTLGINPGGEVAIAGPIPAGAVKSTMINRLITDKDELENATNPDFDPTSVSTGPVHDR